MRLVFLYGPPGVGKLTVGRELSRLTGFRLFHNHLTVDLVTSIFPPDTPAWDDLARRIRLDVFSAAAREGVDVILTRAPRAADSMELERVHTMLAPIRAADGSVVFVQLVCELDELFRRVQGDDRRRRNKLTDPVRLTAMYDLNATLPLEPHLSLDVTQLAPTEAAVRIAKYLDVRSAVPDQHPASPRLL